MTVLQWFWLTGIQHLFHLLEYGVEKLYISQIALQLGLSMNIRFCQLDALMPLRHSPTFWVLATEQEKNQAWLQGLAQSHLWIQQQAWLGRQGIFLQQPCRCQEAGAVVVLVTDPWSPSPATALAAWICKFISFRSTHLANSSLVLPALVVLWESFQ
jgi:hypothetical protein